MAYQVDKFNGTFLTSVEDGTIDSTTDLRLVGKNYAGYGEVQNENFVHLMENFSNTTPPPKVIIGQIWYDSANKKLKFYDGAKFRLAGGAEVSTSAPTGLQIGEFWWDSSAKQLYAYTGTEYVLVGPEASPDLGQSAVQTQVVKDTLNNNHTIVKILSGGKVMTIVSQDEFTLNSSVNPIADFTLIKQGVTLAKTNSTTGVSTDNHRFWGTASDSDRLGGFPASTYLRSTSGVFVNQVRFLDNGFELGGTTVNDAADFRIWIENSDELIIENRLGNEITVRINVTDTTDERDVAIFGPNGVAPGDDNAYDLGTSLSRWKNIYSATVTGNSLVGNLTGNSTGSHIGNLIATDGTTVLINASTKLIGYSGATLRGTLIGAVQGSCIGTADNATTLAFLTPSTTGPWTTASIPIRDAAGEIYATKFKGAADQADQLLVGASYRSASESDTGNTIAARNALGDIYARLFQGTATSAQYADLAEKYLADQEYEIGTVVVVGGEKEVTASSWGQRAIGVVSTNPAYMMNSELEGGTYIALKGRVPCKIIGAVKKGDRLIAGNDGAAMVGNVNSNDVFAIALEDNNQSNIIEVLVL